MSKKSESGAAGAATPSFEERLARLEAISAELRAGQAGLEAATALFEEGMRLARGLERDLARVERRVEVLVNETGGPDGGPLLELFPELADLGGAGGKEAP